eukprot:TRINITY_DN17377_c0_g1_i2.p1 TRINITY_DN17377_c0_g1~~TRINITY_DN17377_c0_g1_i2.p1  ORF type:complete len:200 (-),score=25.65 TRINITY_DN17377_c0_g1_i2:455-1054(-)
MCIRDSRNPDADVNPAPRNMHTRLSNTWRRFNVPEPRIPPCAPQPNRERCIGVYQRAGRAASQIDVCIRTELLSAPGDACNKPCWSPAHNLPTWYLKVSDEPDRPPPNTLDDLLSPGAQRERMLNPGTALPSYGYTEEGVRTVPPRFSYYCPPGNAVQSGSVFTYPFTHHLHGIAAPSRFEGGEKQNLGAVAYDPPPRH